MCIVSREKRGRVEGRDEKERIGRRRGRRKRRGETEWKEVVLRNFEACVQGKVFGVVMGMKLELKKS